MATRGDGTLLKRGRIYYYAYWREGKQHQVSTRKDRLSAARNWRDKFLHRSASPGIDAVTCGQLLDDLLEYADANIKPSTAKIWRLVIEASIRPFFGHLKASTLSTEKMREYRIKRKGEGRSDATVNRELSILRTAFNL